METEHEIEEKPIIVPTREHSSLAVFIGNWAVTGENLADSPEEPDTTVNGIESYEWLSGGFFMVYKWDRYFGNSRHTGIGIINHDEEKHKFSIENFDNYGEVQTYQIINEGSSWTFKGETARAILKFDPDENSFTQDWEILKEKNWKPLCHLQAKKIN
jgi:hypothetical protein